MSKRRMSLVFILALALAASGAAAAQEQPASAPQEKPRRAVVTFDGDLEELPTLAPGDFEIEAGKQKFAPARLYRPDELPTALAIVLQENQTAEFGEQLNALREFILAQPANTYVGLFYLSGQSTDPASLFDSNLEKVTEALRTPKAQVELAPPSPYASIAKLATYMGELPDARKEILWFAEGSDPSAGGASDTANRALAQAVEAAQKAGVPVFVLYSQALAPTRTLKVADEAPPASPGRPGSEGGSGHADEPSTFRGGYNQLYLDYLTDRTGGKVFSKGKPPTDLRPFLNEFRRLLALQYVVEYPANEPVKKIKLRRKVSNAKLLAPGR